MYSFTKCRNDDHTNVIKKGRLLAERLIYKTSFNFVIGILDWIIPIAIKWVEICCCMHESGCITVKLIKQAFVNNCPVDDLQWPL